MTTTTSTDLGARPGQITASRIRGAARVAGSILRAVAARWKDFVDAGQLGPTAETMTSRHTGARI